MFPFVLQELLGPLKTGFYEDTDDEKIPITTHVFPVPKAIIEMVRCQYKADFSSQMCSCRSNDLACTDLRMCSTDCLNDDDSCTDTLLQTVILTNYIEINNFQKIVG